MAKLSTQSSEIGNIVLGIPINFLMIHCIKSSSYMAIVIHACTPVAFVA